VQAFEGNWMRGGYGKVHEADIRPSWSKRKADCSQIEGSKGDGERLLTPRRVAWDWHAKTNIHYSESRIKSTLHIFNPHIWLQF
jgi:hypothetical protein